MDDRFRNETTPSEKISRTPERSNKEPSGDFSVNIDSKSGSGNSAVPSKPKKFEVHIPDLDSAPSAKRTETARQPAKRPVPSQNRVDPAKRPQQKNGSRPSSQTAKGSAAGKKTVKKSAAPVNKKKNVKSSADAAKKRKKRVRNSYLFIKGILISCVCIIFVSIIAVTLSTIALSVVNDILVIDSDASDYSVTVEIPEGADYDQVFSILVDNGLVKQAYFTDLFCRFRHYDAVDIYDKDGNVIETKKIKYEPGVYYLDADSGIEKMLETIMVNSNVAKDTIRLTFPEGWSVAQVFAKIEKYKVCEAEKLYANLDIVGEQYPFIKDITSLEGRYLKAEGYLFPDTYDFFIGENASSVLKKLFNNFDEKWTAENNARLKELGMTKDQIIIIASIIQREAKDGSQMKEISSVIHNRLKDPGTYPNLEMNSTKDYVTSLKSYDLFSDVYYSLYLDRYNTYSSEGLPPGPICNPGKTAIQAALYPAETDYFFFCHDTTTGEIYLAKTAQEHQQNTATVLYGDLGTGDKDE